ncbi:hypothetical protein TNCV_3706151 [Trichonephila clavipes]|nr:hypothetical protein TNCV_3706151 [Trichonephila clavipes]
MQGSKFKNVQTGEWFSTNKGKLRQSCAASQGAIWSRRSASTDLLLGLVMQNATGKIKLELSELYDLKCKLLALEWLGRTQKKFADFLEPLVESCLPEVVLRA